jgi:hypothetical protein
LSKSMPNLSKSPLSSTAVTATLSSTAVAEEELRELNKEKRAHERTRERLNWSRTKVGRLEVENNDLRKDKETLNGTVTSLTASNASLIASNHMLSLAVLRLRAQICTHARTSDGN